ncbi:4904_t:CDS:2 [Acaulospora colombiana]|uniref:4904_t:CDS:1 n=1 Tax=Acaulospora colombiana TaxID=27376 RepID=A0ACA9LE81_9GLOM|nr:4904_t:CDS:2 [Acaulospora colombiana]
MNSKFKLKATELGAFAAKAAIQSLNKTVPIDSVIFGNVCQTDTTCAYLARHVGLRAGLPIETPALTINRLCGSGFQAVISAVQEIRTGDSNIVLTGGTENMSQSGYNLSASIRWGTRYGSDLKLEDSLAATLIDQYPTKTPMGVTAENLAKKYNITREAADEYALTSQKRWDAANSAGRFHDEITPVEIKIKNGTVSFNKDEHARPQTTAEQLAKLPTVFKKDDGVVTAGNASGISDGAGAIIVASSHAVESHGLKPLARIVSYHVSGVEPTIMGIGPVPAIKGALQKAKLNLSDIGLIEVNEAFAPQYLAVEKELGLNREITNTNGAIALGHPLAASGSRILGHLTYELRRTNIQYAIGSACIGGGQGIAIIIERDQADLEKHLCHRDRAKMVPSLFLEHSINSNLLTQVLAAWHETRLIMIRPMNILIEITNLEYMTCVLRETIQSLNLGKSKEKDASNNSPTGLQLKNAILRLAVSGIPLPNEVFHRTIEPPADPLAK